jgi:hypothetical protein
MRRQKRKVYSSQYDTYDKIIDWLNGIFGMYAEHDDCDGLSGYGDSALNLRVVKCTV